MGEASKELLRYRLVYAKRGKARFLSHIDLIHVLQRAFRRARIEVRTTQGFHPKMDLSYGPALPLGMEGLREVVEFRSSHRLDVRQAASRLNRTFPPGLRAVRLDPVGPGEPSLAKAIEGLVYSFAGKNEDFQEAWRAARPAAGQGLGDIPAPAEWRRRLVDFLAARPDAAGIRVVVRGARVRLALPPSPRKGLRPQDIVAEALGLPDPVFLLRRDEVVLQTAAPGIDRAGGIQ
jgi:radical SAM-linked protein